MIQSGNIGAESFEDLPLGSFNVSGLLVPVFPVEDDLTAVGVGIGDLPPRSDGIVMLLRGIDLHFYRAGMILIENILYRVNVVLAHVAQSASVIIPVSPEGTVYTVLVVRFFGSRPEPHLVVEFGGNGLRL